MLQFLSSVAVFFLYDCCIKLGSVKLFVQCKRCNYFESRLLHLQSQFSGLYLSIVLS